MRKRKCGMRKCVKKNERFLRVTFHLCAVCGGGVQQWNGTIGVCVFCRNGDGKCDGDGGIGRSDNVSV